MMKKTICAFLTGTMLCSSVVSVSAKDIFTADAELRPDISIVINDETQVFKNANGETVYPILYQDSTYLPLRAIGEIMGKNVNWDEDNKTVTLSGKRDDYSSNTDRGDGKRKDIEVQERRDFTIIVDGEKCTFYDANKKRVYPVLYDGSTYLPLRAIGEIMDSEVGWNDRTKTVTLDYERDQTVTDADTFKPTDKEDRISPAKAKEIALKHAGYDSKDVYQLTADLDKKEEAYEVKFYSDGRKYEYVIDAYSGKILESSSDNIFEDKRISLDEAKEIALDYAGIKKVDKYQKEFYDSKDGNYEIEFIYNDMKYEFEINAYSRRVLKYECEPVDNSDGNDNAISVEKAKKIALKYAGVKESDAKFVKAKMDIYDGRKKYEVEFYSGGREYSVEIDAVTGKVLEMDIDD